MKKIIMTVSIALFLTGCGHVKGDTTLHDTNISNAESTIKESVQDVSGHQKIDVSSLDKSAPTERIVLVYNYINWAEGFQCYGSFIDNLGNLYEYDFSTYTYGADWNDELFKQSLWESYLHSEPVKYNIADSSELNNILNNDFYNIDTNAEMTEECTGSADVGQYSLYICGTNFEMIKLRSIGDWNEEMQDETAQKICEYFDNVIKNK